MLNAVIIDKKDSDVLRLTDHLKKYCPFLQCKGVVENSSCITSALRNPENNILFINPLLTPLAQTQQMIASFAKEKSIICINKTNDYAELAVAWKSSAYLRKPFGLEKLIHAVEQARGKIENNFKQLEREQLLQQLLKRKEQNNLLGIPTIKGFEIIDVNDIIRCEGLQKCTKIITSQKGIVSSYSIGMFKSILAPYPNFFFSHRSHIINLKSVKAYQKCGIIVLKDNATVPVSKNNKEKFLSLILHI